MEEHLHGSIVAALYAMGYRPNEMLNLFQYFGKSIVDANPMYMFSSMRENKSFEINGMRSGGSIEYALNEAAKYKNLKYLADLEKCIVITTVDLQTGKEFIFTNTKEREEENYIKEFEIAKAVRASSSFPILFAPFKYKEYTFVDGGVLSNVPASEVRNAGADKVIAVNFFEENVKTRNSIYSIVLRTLDIMTNQIAQNNLKEADNTILVNTGEIKILQMNKIKECYQIGYEIGIQNITKIKDILSS